jgi:peptide/nickel transport system permease protein
VSVALTLRRLLSAVPALLGVMVISFALTRLSGDPTNLLLPTDASAEARAAFRASHYLDRPILEQLVHFIGRAVMGDFDNSLRFGQPAAQLVRERLGATIELALATLLIAAGIGIPGGVLAATRRGQTPDLVVRGIAVLGQAVPTFYAGVVAIIVFAVGLRWFPTGGRSGWLSLVLPAATLSLNFIAIIMRVARSSMLDALRQDYMRTALAKGLSRSAIVWVHAFRNALIPVVTLIALQVGTLMGGVVVTETLFAWPGIGQLAIQAIYARDYPVIQAVVFFFAITFVLVNLLADLLIGVLDPRARRQ